MYCVFNVYTKCERLIVFYMAVLRREIALAVGDKRRLAFSVYFGGGIFSLVLVDEIAAMFDVCWVVFALQFVAEIMLELNLEFGDEAYFFVLYYVGVNWLSIGM